jgi:hypothetical protein
VARVVAYVPDLLFGSNVLASVQAAGHEGVLVTEPSGLAAALPGAAALVLDLTLDPAERIDHVRTARPAGLPVLAFYAHVEADVRAQAQAAGFELVIPRSRMAREGGELIARLADSGGTGGQK